MDGSTLVMAFCAAFLFFIVTLNICSRFMSEKATLITCGIVSGVAAIYMLVGTEDMQYIGLCVMTGVGLIAGLRICIRDIIKWFKKLFDN